MKIAIAGDAYRPSEDTWLIYDYLKSRELRGDVCADLGSGTGVLGIRLLLERKARRCVFVDLQEDAAISAREGLELNNCQHRGLVVLSNGNPLRSSSLSLVVSNPPYLPRQGPGDIDITCEGGPGGYETILHFADIAREALAAGGSLVLLYSSLSNPGLIKGELSARGFSCIKGPSRNLFFETLYIEECVLNEDQSSLSRRRGPREPGRDSQDLR